MAESAIMERESMNRVEFMRQLEELLHDIPRYEREEAIQYYNDYFDDAGVESEPNVIEALGNPARVARTILQEWYENEERANRQVRASDRVLANFEKKESANPIPTLYFGAVDMGISTGDDKKTGDTYREEMMTRIVGTANSKQIGKDTHDINDGLSKYGDKSDKDDGTYSYGDRSDKYDDTYSYGDRSDKGDGTYKYGDKSDNGDGTNKYRDKSDNGDGTNKYRDKSDKDDGTNKYGDDLGTDGGTYRQVDSKYTRKDTNSRADFSDTTDVTIKKVAKETGSSNDRGFSGASGNSNSNFILIAAVIGCVILFPILIGILGSIFGAVIGILAGWFGAMLGFGGAALGLFFSSVVLVITGGAMAVSSPLLGIGLIGGGLLTLGLGVLFLMLTVWMAGTATPAMVRALKKLIHTLHQFIKKKVKKQSRQEEKR
jgi:uncharacterized membrane protein